MIGPCSDRGLMAGLCQHTRREVHNVTVCAILTVPRVSSQEYKPVCHHGHEMPQGGPMNILKDAVCIKLCAVRGTSDLQVQIVRPE